MSSVRRVWSNETTPPCPRTDMKCSKRPAVLRPSAFWNIFHFCLRRLSSFLSRCRSSDTFFIAAFVSLYCFLVAWSFFSTNSAYRCCPSASACPAFFSRFFSAAYALVSFCTFFESAPCEPLGSIGSSPSPTPSGTW